MAARLTCVSSRVVAILADNGIASVVADLAAMSLGVPVVVLPVDLSENQLRDVIRKTGVDCVLTDRPNNLATRDIGVPSKALPIAGGLFEIEVIVDASAAVALPAGTAKVIVTTGKTGTPKILCIGHTRLEFAAEALLGAAARMQGDRHLCRLPLSTSHENIGGICTSILAGATMCVPRLKNSGITGQSIRVDELVASLDTWRATSVLTSAEILRSLVAAAERGVAVPNSIRYVAVGSAFPPALLAAADRQRIPVYGGSARVEPTAMVSVPRPMTAPRGVVENSLTHVCADDFDNLQPFRSARRYDRTNDDAHCSATAHPTSLAQRRLS